MLVASTAPAPVISGSPPATIAAGNLYSFLPSATGAESFSITNQPYWTDFDPATGALTGTPTNIDADTYPDIVIGATGTGGTVSLPPFSITVTPAATIWQQTGLPSDARPSQVIVDPAGGGTVYALATTGLFKSINGGSTWHPVSAGGAAITSLAADPLHLGTLFAGTDSGLFKSVDGGSSWRALGGVFTSQATVLGVGPGDGWVYAMADGLLRRSTDGGGSWSGGTAFYPSHFVIDPTDSRVLYDGTGGVYKSNDGGANWVEADTGITKLARPPPRSSMRWPSIPITANPSSSR
ncbi:hypothetical protein GMSM_22630 [Geomonas sp. Red276]